MQVGSFSVDNGTTLFIRMEFSSELSRLGYLWASIFVAHFHAFPLKHEPSLFCLAWGPTDVDIPFHHRALMQRRDIWKK